VKIHYFPSFSLSTYARICVRSSYAHPLLPTVIRGLLTRRVAPAPARQSFTLESNPRPPHASRCYAMPGVLSRLSPSTKEGFFPVDRCSPKVKHHRELYRDEKSRRRRERYWRRSLTTLPLLAWRPSWIVPIYVYVTDVYSRHAEPPFLAPWRNRGGGGGGDGTHAEEIATLLATF